MHIRHLRALLFRHGIIQNQIDAEQAAPRVAFVRLNGGLPERRACKLKDVWRIRLRPKL